MPKKKKENELTPEEQWKQFKEAEKKLEISSETDHLDNAFKRLAPKNDRLDGE
ncbi:MAG: hypothetical protein AAFV69_14100 [Pseudomonadota bacterium]